MNTDTITPPFESWAVAEIFGHQKYAGFVTQMTLGNQIMWRIDVPAIGDNAAFTKIFGLSAIFSLTPCSEDIVRKLIASWQVQSAPLHIFQLTAGTDPPSGYIAPGEDADDDDIDDEHMRP